ncbi:hypothetical protein Taro_024130 [Colocasia esculenta]|uniref:Uncharacterized protein n=1 Tax=Colocasia esculenta TaxID=4460 RepID=A0A843V5K3_COLES|nr:hypothetical protein [Colocasia esculenta]
MDLLLSFFFIVETVFIPYGVTKCRLRHYIHPSLLVVSVLFLVGETLVRSVLLVPVPPLGITGRVILTGFRLFKGWIIGLILIAANLVTAPEGSAGGEEYFHDCSQESEDVEVELDPAGTIVPCDQWHVADHEPAGNPCRSVVLSSDYASVLPVNANVTVQQYQENECFVEEGCLDWDKAEGKREPAAIICTDEEQRREDGSSVLHEDMLPATSEAWGEELNDVVLPTLQIGDHGSAEDESKPPDSDSESERSEELDDVTFLFLPLTAGVEGVAEEPDPAAFIDQLDADEDLDQEREAASSFWLPIDWNEDAEEEAYALQSAAETSLAIRVAERDEQHDIFYRQYMKKMGWFDQLNSERIHQASAILEMDLRDPGFLESIQPKIRSLQGTTLSSLIKGVERDLEQVYVAQSCLGWAVLHDQYRTVESLASSSSAGNAFPCGNVTGKFQQFRVLLHRYMENECREVNRFWSYCQSRFSAANLLQVPDVSVFEAFGADAAAETTTASDMLVAIEKAIQVFWDFLETDNCRPSGILKKLLWTNPQVDDARDLDLLDKLKKEVGQKDKRLKDLRKTRRRGWKKTTPVLATQGIKTLLSLIDIKLVSRVLRMSSISTPQLRWCQGMLESIEINNGRVVRSCNGTFLFPSS